MVKYSSEFRMEVVSFVLNQGHSMGEASREFGVPMSPIRKWVHWYHAHGPGVVRTNKSKYTPEFKLSVVQHMLKTGLSSQQAAVHFAIPSPALILSWKQAYEKDGFPGLLPKPKGRKPKVSDKPPKPNKPRKPKEPERELTREEVLEKENEQLRMEVAYLKKLNALVLQREESEKKTK